MACSMGTGKQPAMGSLDVPRRDSPATNVSALMTNVECSFPTSEGGGWSEPEWSIA